MLSLTCINSFNTFVSPKSKELGYTYNLYNKQKTKTINNKT